MTDKNIVLSEPGITTRSEQVRGNCGKEKTRVDV